MNEWAVLLGASTLLVTLLGFQWKFFLSLDKRFLELKEDILKIKNELIDKIEYHEQHDDKRFSDVTDNIWMLRLRNAAKDGLRPDQWLKYKSNYLPIESNGNSQQSPL